MRRLAKVLAVSVLGWGAWSVFSHERSVRPPDGVLVQSVPLQHNYVDEKPSIRHGAYTLLPRAHYDITGRVLLLIPYSDGWSNLAPLDVALGWQEMSDNLFLASLTITGDRRTLLVVSTDNSIQDYNPLLARSSNNHLIPEDAGIESQLRALRVGQVVRLSGELVDVSGPNGFEAHTSLLRLDVGDNACEIILVRGVQVKN